MSSWLHLYTLLGNLIVISSFLIWQLSLLTILGRFVAEILLFLFLCAILSNNLLSLSRLTGHTVDLCYLFLVK